MADIARPAITSSLPGNSDRIDCITCDAAKEYSDLAEGYIHALSGVLYAPLMTIFLSLVGLWAIVTGYKFWLAMVSPMHVMRDLFAIIIAFVLLNNQGSTLITGIYSASLEIMTGAAVMAFSLGPGSSDLGSGIGAAELMKVTEEGVSGIFSAAAEVISNSGRWNPIPYVFAVLLVLPYFLVVVVFFSKVVVSIFRIMMLGIFAPFMIMFFAFGWGRGMAISGAKTLVSAMFVLFAASVSVGLLLYGVDTLVGNLSKDAAGGANILSSGYLTVMILGWLGTALMAEGIGLANSITGTILTNDAAKVIAGGVTGTVYAVGRAAWNEGGGDAIKKLLGGAVATPGREYESVKRGNDLGTATVRDIRLASDEGINRVKEVLGFKVERHPGSPPPGGPGPQPGARGGGR